MKGFDKRGGVKKDKTQEQKQSTALTGDRETSKRINKREELAMRAQTITRERCRKSLN